MTTYLSGPMTGLPDYNIPAFRATAASLRAEGVDVLDPSERGVIPSWEWEDYLRADLADLLSCNAIALLPGWEASRGARLELHVARELGFSIRHL